mmetsp:Transcript_20488/g.28814  ORF Transcript_20488/g.28814 Transcript_20488/m.28814 type:complete len:291 (+) Transcript_20488:673-1545(+)
MRMSDIKCQVPKPLVIPEFIHTRKIKIDSDKFMNCSCEKTGEYLLPCPHICSVIGNDKYFTSDTFHVRWHEKFPYTLGKENDNTEHHQQHINTSRTYADLYKTTRNHYYCNKGLYKGIPLNDNLFLKDLPQYDALKSLDKMTLFMIFLREESKKKPVLQNTTLVDTYLDCLNDTDDGCNIKNKDIFSIMTQEAYKGFEDSTMFDIKLSPKHDVNSPYHHTYDIYEQALKMTKTKDNLDELTDVLQNYVNRRIHESKRILVHEGETIIFGENNTNCNRTIKRHKFLYELLS